MVAKTTIKLIDEAIIPALLLIISKMFGLFLANYFLKLNYEVNYRGFLNFLPSISYQNPQDYISAENYSNLAMFVSCAAGMLYITAKAHFLHESHIAPKVQQKLAAMNLEKFISPSFHLYHQVAIWLIFLWLTTGFLALSTLLKITYWQITALALFISVNFSWFFMLDIQKEIEISNNRP